MKHQNILILSIGIFLIIISLFIFTRPAIFDSWDFSDTGEIGDTIGGITAPIINLIGAFLVYISFQAQINANRIQTDALESEKSRNSTSNIYEKHLSLFDDIKIRLQNLDFIVELKGHSNPDGSFTQPIHMTYRGLNALNEYVIRIEVRDPSKPPSPFAKEIYSTRGIFLNFQFIVTVLSDLIERIEINIESTNDKEFLLRNIKLFYAGFITDFSSRIIDSYPSESPEISELQRIKEKIDEKFSA